MYMMMLYIYDHILKRLFLNELQNETYLNRQSDEDDGDNFESIFVVFSLAFKN